MGSFMSGSVPPTGGGELAAVKELATARRSMITKSQHPKIFFIIFPPFFP
jgi:hypothetical protein